MNRPQVQHQAGWPACHVHRLLRLMGLVVLLPLLSACGYTTQSIYPQNIQTVAVRPIGNDTFYRGVEFELREAVMKEIEFRTPYKVVTTNVADSELQINIVGLSQRVINHTEVAGLPQEMEVDLIIDFFWRDLTTGDTLRERTGLHRVGRYIPTRPVSENFAIGQSDVVESVAQAVVSTMREQWKDQ